MNYQAFVMLLGVGGLCLFAGLYGSMIFPQMTLVQGSTLADDGRIQTLMSGSAYTNIQVGQSSHIIFSLYEKLHQSVGVPGQPIRVYLNDQLLDTMTTDSFGQVSFDKTFDAAGSYIFRAMYDGSTVYGPNSVSVGVVVLEPGTAPAVYVPLVLTGLGIIGFALWRRKTL